MAGTASETVFWIVMVTYVYDNVCGVQQSMIHGGNIRAECAIQWTESVTSRFSDWIAEDNVFVREALMYVGGPAG